MGKDWRIPVGRVEYRYLYPLTFFEYLDAMGKQDLLLLLSNIKIGDDSALLMFAENEYKQYLLLGGMPEVVADYSINHNFDRCREILTRIHSTYIEDISKYEKSETWRKYLETVVTEGPRAAGSIFNYENFAGSSYKSREMSEALRKVEKTMLCKQLPVINSTILPVTYKQKRSKKLIWLDVGIVNLINNIYPELLTGVYGGKLMEQIVGQTLLAIMSNNLIKLAYFAKDRDMGSAEVDFCFPWKQYLVGIEVKSGDNLNSKSLTSMIKDGEGRVVPIKVSWGKLEVKNGIINVPFYLLERWEYFVSNQLK